MIKILTVLGPDFLNIWQNRANTAMTININKGFMRYLITDCTLLN